MRWHTDSTKRSKRVFTKFALICLGAGLIMMALGHKIILTYLGDYLRVDNLAQPVDIGIVLSGEFPIRIMEAAALLRENKIKRLVLMRQSESLGEKVLEQWGYSEYSDYQMKINLLSDLGIDLGRVITIDDQAASTSQEALFFKKWLKENGAGVRSIVLITTATHTRRSLLIFRKQLGERLEIYAKPSRYDHFATDNWWRSRHYLKEVIFEYEKFLAVYLLD